MTEEIKDPEGLLKAYNKAKEDLVTLRSQLKDLETEREQFSEEAVTKWKNLAARAQALNALQAEGIKDGERFLKHMDLSDVEYDEESGAIKGIEEKLDAFKKDFSELFDAKKRAGRSSADIHEATPVKKELSPSEQQAALLYG